MNEGEITGIILIVFGVLYLLKPGIILKFQIWTQKKIMGANYQPSERTYKAIRIIGGLILTLGLLIIAGIVK